MKNRINRIKKYGSLVLIVGSLVLGGCSRKNTEYEFRGKLGREYVEFRPTHLSNFLTVRKEDGNQIQYCDIITDGKVDEVRIGHDNLDTKILRQSDVSNEIWNSVQNSYEDYLVKILKTKQCTSSNYLKLFEGGRE